MSDGGSGAPGDEPPSDGHESDADADDDAPLSDLARRVSRQRRGRGDRSDGDDRDDGATEEPAPDLDAELSDGPPPDPGEDPFDRMAVGEVDEETLWSSLGDDDAAGVGVETGVDVDVDGDAGPDAGTDSIGGVGPSPGVESVDDAQPGVAEHIVPKDKYCQSCPYLDDPPELACTHEGTEIVEVVDSERFRVRDCPMVEGGVEPKK